MDPEMVRLQQEEADERADLETVAKAVRDAARNGYPVAGLSEDILAAELVKRTGAFGTSQASALAAVRAWRERSRG